jgi:hypothetical protein
MIILIVNQSIINEKWDKFFLNNKFGVLKMIVLIVKSVNNKIKGS